MKTGKRVNDSHVIMKIRGPKSEGVPGDWRKLHNEELLDLY
jgi:hypothetical protein